MQRPVRLHYRRLEAITLVVSTTLLAHPCVHALQATYAPYKPKSKQEPLAGCDRPRCARRAKEILRYARKEGQSI